MIAMTMTYGEPHHCLKACPEHSEGCAAWSTP